MEGYELERHGTPHWWMTGDQFCEFCWAPFPAEVEVRCIRCDRPICMLCVVRRAEQETICPECSHGLGEPGEEV